MVDGDREEPTCQHNAKGGKDGQRQGKNRTGGSETGYK